MIIGVKPGSGSGGGAAEAAVGANKGAVSNAAVMARANRTVFIGDFSILRLVPLQGVNRERATLSPECGASQG
jgi:hypothetical protein